MAHELPTVVRVPYDEHARRVAPAKDGDPDYTARIAREATRIEPLQAMQVAFDQLVRHAEGRTRGEPWQHSGTWPAFVADTLTHAERHRDVLRTAADAADAMIADIKAQTERLQSAMSKKAEEDKKAEAQHPQLTTSGEPHPLEEGGYDANADANKPVNESDVAALKAGHASPAQAEAMVKADTADDDAKDPAESRSASAPADDDDTDAPKSRPKGHGHGKK